MQQVWQQIWSGLTGASWLDQANLALGIAGVILMVRRSLWAFPVGLVAVSVQGVLFFHHRFYADAVLQGFFFGALTYGWWHWTHPRAGARELPVTVLGNRARVGLLVLGVVGTLLWAFGLRRYTDAVMPVRDAFIAVFSVIAQVLQARKQLDNWPCWLGVNAVAVSAYAVAGLHYTAFLYAVYFALALAGWREWARARNAAVVS